LQWAVRGGTYHGAEFLCGLAQQGDRVEIPNSDEESDEDEIPDVDMNSVDQRP